MKTKAFYHVALMKSWNPILQEQMSTISRSGILNSIPMEITVIGDEKDFYSMKKEYGFLFRRNVDVRYIGADFSVFEFPTLDRLYSWSISNRDCCVLYFHTKGISHDHYDKDKKIVSSPSRWRRTMMFHCVEGWKKCLRILREGERCFVRTCLYLLPL